ncbi:MAG: hypothetical protein V9H26_29135 [Verrucomicrobiota bacterium]
MNRTAQFGRTAHGGRELPRLDDRDPGADKRFERHRQPGQSQIATATAEERQRMQNPLDERPPAFAVLALAGVNQHGHEAVERKQYSKGLREVAQPVAGRKELYERENKNGGMQQKGGIRQIANHLTEGSSAGGIVIRQHAKTGIEPATALARVDQCQVKARNPVAGMLEGFSEGPTGGNPMNDLLEWFAKAPGGWIPFQLFQGAHNRQACHRELTELVVEFRTPGELAGGYERGGRGH